MQPYQRHLSESSGGTSNGVRSNSRSPVRYLDVSEDMDFSETSEDERRLITTVNESQTNLRLASSALEDALDRLQRIRNTVRELEVQGLVSSDSISPPDPNIFTRPNPNPSSQNTYDDTRERGDSDLNNLRTRLESMGSSLPRYIRSTSSLLRTIGQLSDNSSLTQRVRTSTTHALLSPPSGSRSDSLEGSHSSAATQTRQAPVNGFFPGFDTFQNTLRQRNDASTTHGRRITERAAARSLRSTSTQSSSQYSRSFLPSWTLLRDEERRSSLNNLSGPPIHNISRMGTDTGSDTESEDTALMQMMVEIERLRTITPQNDDSGAGRAITDVLNPQMSSNITRSGLQDREIQSGGDYLPDVYETLPGNRTYRIRRRINADGEEEVRHIRTDGWWNAPDVSGENSRSLNDFESRRPLPRTSQRPIIRPVADRGSQVAPTRPLPEPIGPTDNARTRRRRGWTFLNADGDEVQRNEDDSIQGRNSSRSANTTNPNTALQVHVRLHYLPPSSRDIDMSPADEVSNRFRWSDGSGFGIEPDLLGKEDFREPFEILEQDNDFFGSSTPYYVNPLPTPLQQTISEVNDERIPSRKPVAHVTSTYTAIR